MARTDLTDEAEVKDHLEKLRVSVNHVLTSFALCPSPRFRQNWDQYLKFALTNPLTALLLLPIFFLFVSFKCIKTFCSVNVSILTSYLYIHLFYVYENQVIEKELDEQGIRLQSLHKAGEDLLKNVDAGDPAAKEIKTQLKDFDDCWNDIAKQVINRIQQVKKKKKEKFLEKLSWLGLINFSLSGFPSAVCRQRSVGS